MGIIEREKTMIERALQIVKQTGDTVHAAVPDRRDSVSAFEQIQSKRSNTKEEAENSSASFQVKKSFSNGASMIARTLGQFNKALNLLESKTYPDESDDVAPPKNQRQNDTNTFSSDKTTFQSVPQVSGNTNSEPANFEEQLELNLSGGKNPSSFKEQSKPSLELKKFDDLPVKRGQFQETPQIDIGINPSNFKIHTIITDEIIKAISNTSAELNIKDVGEHLASKLANEVRKQLANQPHAIATNQGAAPLRTLEQAV